VGELLKFQVGFGMAEHSNPPRKIFDPRKGDRERLESDQPLPSFRYVQAQLAGLTQPKPLESRLI